MLGAGLLLGGPPNLLGLTVMLRGQFSEASDMMLLMLAWLLEGMLASLLYGLATLVLIQPPGSPRMSVGALWSRLLHRSLSIASTSGLTWLITRIGLVLLIVPGLILAPCLCLAAPAAAAEPGGPIAALRQAWRLGRGARWRLSGVLLLMFFVHQLGALSIALLAARVVNDTSASLFLGAYAVGQVLSDIIAAPLLAAAYVELTSGEDGPANHLAAVFD